MRERGLRWTLLCCLALAALELTAFYQFNYGGWIWDWTVRTPLAGVLLFAAGALPGGTPYKLCYGVTLVLSMAEILYHHWLVCRHKAQS